MSNNKLRCAMLGCGEKELPLLSELHRQDRVRIVFVYDSDPTAVGMEISEILGIPRHHRVPDLSGVGAFDYLIVSEPRARFSEELKALAGTGANVITPGGAFKLLVGDDVSAAPADDVTPYTIEETLVALEKLLDRGELLKFLLDVAVRAVDARAGSVMLYSSEAKDLYIAYATGLSERVIKSTRQKLGEGIAGSVALNKQARVITQPADSSLYSHSSRDRERLDIGSAISVPLLWSGELLGVLNVSSGKNDPPHTESDLKRLKALSRRLSRVLFESQKVQEVQMRHRETRFRTTMGEIAEKDIETREKFSVLSRYLADLVSAETVEIFVNTAEGDWLVLGGSNRLLSPQTERVRYQRGALSRAFLEDRCIVLTESATPDDDLLAALSSAVYCPLPLKETGGVIAFEFSERTRLDEFLIIRDAIVADVSRFVGSEMRERELRRKLASLGRISDAAPALLACRTIDDVGSVLARVVGDVVECDRVSVRLRRSADDDSLRESFLSPPGETADRWRDEDEKRYARLSETKQAYSVSFLNFDPAIREAASESQSMIAIPVEVNGEFCGGVIAFSKHPSDPLEDAIFTDLDRALLENLIRLIGPVLEGVYTHGVVSTPGEIDSYRALLDGNTERFAKLCDSEILRSNRYHHTFAVVLFRIKPLEQLFEKDHKSALTLVDEITQGIRTRTRKTDYGCWIDTTTYAMLSLEGSQRIQFLVSRAMLYLGKDVAEFARQPVDKDDIHVGVAMYPGTARTATELFQEAEKDLKPHTE